ncbi:tRNA-methyltransferase O, putative [Leishmania lindenbergi]|uniref:tRNA-methyltransferase O n=1 Tax=Leishmania lindenbergi TaxID=651832 RepID=A0AAW3AGH1_9TRYP
MNASSWLPSPHTTVAVASPIASVASADTATGAAASPTVPVLQHGVSRKRHRVRVNYFLVGDLVWVRPAKLPYWPAEVIDCDEAANRVRARLIVPPPAAVLAANLAEEQRKHQEQRKREEMRAIKMYKRGSKPAPPTATGNEASSAHGQPAACTLGVDSDTRSTSCGAAALLPEPQSDVVTASGQVVYFFDKLRTTEELDVCLESRLQRSTHDVALYESAFTQAVLQANRLTRISLSPEKLQPYEVCAVGIVHSLMRAQIEAPRQPNTGTFEPQTGLIRLRTGLENAARDLAGFEFIWVLFQFSFAAPMASGEGQEMVRKFREAREAGASPDAGPVSPAPVSASDTTPKTEPTADGDGNVCCYGDAEALMTSTLSFFRQRQGFDRAAGFKTMIIPPRDEEWRGVFATRSPHRPNFIGLSCVRLVAVHGLNIHIADHDLLHGTPVLDIKPYLPFCDAHPNARAGWVDALDASGNGKGDHKYDRQAKQVHRATLE